MKTIIKNTVASIPIVLLTTGVFSQTSDRGYQQDINEAYEAGYEDGFKEGEEVNYQKFYDELSPHGRWINYPEHGYVWSPNVGSGFRPYSTNGRWVYTNNYDWMWVSNYSWGWAPFHYGRWFQDAAYGWLWVPGYEWSPAWVAWRQGGDYYGWAPLRPGISISVGFNIGSYNPPMDYWCFAPRKYINSRNINRYYVSSSRNVTIINQTTIINNYNYSTNVFRSGPRRVDVEIYTGRINPVRFRATNTAGRTRVRSNEVNVYRPVVRNANGRAAEPRSFERFDSNNNRSSNSTVRTNNGTNRIKREQSVVSSREGNSTIRSNRNSTNSNTNRSFERKSANTTRERTVTTPRTDRNTNRENNTSVRDKKSRSTPVQTNRTPAQPRKQTVRERPSQPKRQVVQPNTRAENRKPARTNNTGGRRF